VAVNPDRRRRDPQPRSGEVLRAFVARIDCTPFGSGRARGYPFKGVGDYGALFGETPLTRGVLEGKRP
jgi:hypothetical protein